MSHKVIIFQTLKDKGNPEEIKSDGPFICRWKNSWLGTGYYFWEHYLNNAHWWGKAHLSGNYVICQANYIYDHEKIFDLSGSNFKHNDDFESYCNFLQKQGFVKENETTISTIFQFLRNYIKSFNYEATRAYGINSIGEKSYPEHIFRMKFETKLNAYLDNKPAIQICFYDKKNLNLSDYKIIHPDQYTDQYVF